MFFVSKSGYSQQDVTFSMNMFNPLFANPATAGYQDKQIVKGLYRYQWVGVPGNPHSAVASYETPMANKNIALGFLGKFDKLGLMTNLGFDANFAYRIPLDEKIRLSLGLRGSLFQISDDRPSAVTSSPTDPTAVTTLNRLMPNFGVGGFLFSDRFFVGASVPHILNLRLRDDVDTSTGAVFSKMYNHYFASVGAVFGKSEKIKFKPTAFFKMADGVTPDLDINANFLFNERYWLGLGYRNGGDVINRGQDNIQFSGFSGEALIFIFKMMATQSLEIGYAYDFPLSDLRQSTSGSHELYIGYEFGASGTNRFVSPRYVNYF